MPLAIAPFTELVPVSPDTLFICRSDGASELVMNRAQQWTPLALFAQPFPAEYARAIAQHSRAPIPASGSISAATLRSFR